MGVCVCVWGGGGGERGGEEGIIVVWVCKPVLLNHSPFIYLAFE